MRSNVFARLVGVAPLVAILVLASNADAFCRTTTVPPSPDAVGCVLQGQPLYHPGACVTYRIQANPNPGTKNVPLEERYNLSGVMARAFVTWTSTNDRCNGISLVELEPLKVAKIAEYLKDGPNNNMIGFVSGPWPHGGGDTLALTTLSFNATTGEVFDADLEIREDEKWWDSGADPNFPSDAYDLDSAMIHEAGHFLGLSHVDDPKALMFAAYTPGDVRRTLSADDKLGICTAYPNKQTRSTGTGLISATACNLAPAPAPGTPTCGDPEIKHGCSTAPSDASSKAGTFAIIAAAAAALIFARRRRH